MTRTHHINCGFWLDQYPNECDCGVYSAQSEWLRRLEQWSNLMTRDTEDMTPLPPNQTIPPEPPGKFHSNEMHTFHDDREKTMKAHEMIMISAAVIYTQAMLAFRGAKKSDLVVLAVQDAILLWKQIQKEQETGGFL